MKGLGGLRSVVITNHICNNNTSKIQPSGLMVAVRLLFLFLHHHRMHRCSAISFSHPLRSSHYFHGASHTPDFCAISHFSLGLDIVLCESQTVRYFPPTAAHSRPPELAVEVGGTSRFCSIHATPMCAISCPARCRHVLPHCPKMQHQIEGK